MKYSEIRESFKKEKMKLFFDRTYGSGNVNFLGCIIAFALIIMGIGVMMLPAFSAKIKEVFGTICFWWIVSFALLVALFFISSYLYCKPVHGKDKLGWLKKGLFITVFYLFMIILSPFILMIWFTNKIAKVLNLKNMAEHAIDSIVTLLLWGATFILSLFVMLIIGVSLVSILEEKYNAFYTVMNDEAIICYMVFVCMLLSNKMSVKYFFFVNMVKKEDERKKFYSEMALLWNYTIFAITLFLKPLNTDGTVFGVLVDAFFYSSTVISLLAKIADGKKKLSIEEREQGNEILEEIVEAREENKAGDENEHRKFSQRYWNYYLVLEKELKEIVEFVSLRKENLETSSNRITSLLLNVGAEFDFLCKQVCGFSPDSRKNIADYAKTLLKQNKDLQKTEITVLDSELSISPFKNWDKRHASDLFWWEAYTAVKHNRIDNATKGSLENLVNAMGALYYLEMYYIKKLADKEDNPEVIDVPISRSEFFKIKGWVTRYMCIGYNTYIDYEPEL